MRSGLSAGWLSRPLALSFWARWEAGSANVEERPWAVRGVGSMSGPEVYVLGFPRSLGGTCGHLLAVRYSRAAVQRTALWSWISLSVSPACSVG